MYFSVGQLSFPYMKKEMQITLCTTVYAFVVCTIMMGPNCLHYQECYSASSIIFPHGNAHVASNMPIHPGILSADLLHTAAVGYNWDRIEIHIKDTYRHPLRMFPFN